MEIDQRCQLISRVVVLGDAGASTLQQPLADVDEHLRQDRLLAGEVAVDGGAGDAELSAEVVDGHPVEARDGVHAGSRGDDLRTAVAARGHGVTLAVAAPRSGSAVRRLVTASPSGYA